VVRRSSIRVEIGRSSVGKDKRLAGWPMSSESTTQQKKGPKECCLGAREERDPGG